MKKLKSGFTLIELMVVISVIAILSTIALIGLRSAQNSAKDTKKISTINGMRAALERMYTDTNAYPLNWAAVTAAGSTFASYLTVPTSATDDSALTTCAASSTHVGPCVWYDGSGTTGYTVTFYKNGGGSAVYSNPQ
jgi:prepilin-type N-terminal cleavage/methylation domain-containing protein